MFLSKSLQEGLFRYVRGYLGENQLIAKNIAQKAGLHETYFNKLLRCKRHLKETDAVNILKALDGDFVWLKKEIESEKRGSYLELVDESTVMSPHTISLHASEPPEEAIQFLVNEGVLKPRLTYTWISKHYDKVYESTNSDVFLGINSRSDPGKCFLHFANLQSTPAAVKIYNYLISPNTLRPPVISRIDFPIDYKSDICEIICAHPRSKKFKTYSGNDSTDKGTGISHYIGQRYVYYQKPGSVSFRIEARLKHPKVVGKKLVLGKELQNLKNPFSELCVYRLQPKLLKRSELELLISDQAAGFCIQRFRKFNEFSDYEVSKDDPNHPSQVWEQVYDRYLFELAQCFGISPEDLGINPKIALFRDFVKKRGLALRLPSYFGKIPFRR